MAATLVTSDHDTIISEIDITAPPDRVFRGICDPETVRRRAPHLDVFEMDLRVGGKWRMEIRMPKPHRGVSSSSMKERFLRSTLRGSSSTHGSPTSTTIQNIAPSCVGN